MISGKKQARHARRGVAKSYRPCLARVGGRAQELGAGQPPSHGSKCIPYGQSSNLTVCQSLRALIKLPVMLPYRESTNRAGDDLQRPACEFAVSRRHQQRIRFGSGAAQSQPHSHRSRLARQLTRRLDGSNAIARPTGRDTLLLFHNASP